MTSIPFPFPTDSLELVTKLAEEVRSPPPDESAPPLIERYRAALEKADMLYQQEDLTQLKTAVDTAAEAMGYPGKGQIEVQPHGWYINIDGRYFTTITTEGRRWNCCAVCGSAANPIDLFETILAHVSTARWLEKHRQKAAAEAKTGKWFAAVALLFVVALLTIVGLAPHPGK